MKRTLFLPLIIATSLWLCLDCTGTELPSQQQQILQLRNEIDSLKKINNELNQRLIRLEEQFYRNPQPEPPANATQRIKKQKSTVTNRIIYTGPRGGRYYINDKGRKVYIKK